MVLVEVVMEFVVVVDDDDDAVCAFVVGVVLDEELMVAVLGALGSNIVSGWSSVSFSSVKFSSNALA